MSSDSHTIASAMATSGNHSLDDTKLLVQKYWNENPCGSKFSKEAFGTKPFFDEIEFHRYQTEWHIPEIVAFHRWAGRDVLELGCGLGTDALQFARHGARYTGVDLTPRSVELTALRFRQENLEGKFLNADAENLPFPDNCFDLVYSHGVLHHTPNTLRAIGEVHRVLRKGGTAMIMLYNRHSYNYYGNIRLLRRLGAGLLAYEVGRKLTARLTGETLASLQTRWHAMRSQPQDFWREERFLSDNTDGVGNPLSKVFTRAEVRRMFSSFTQVRTSLRFLNKKWIPVVGPLLPRFVDGALARLCGWHLWIRAEK